MPPAKDIAHPEELIGSRAIINGASGAGKSHVLRRLLEQTHGHMQHLVLDVEDEFFTLRERFDYVLIGGDGADAPITEETARQMARTLLELGVSAILQLNDLGLAGQRRLIGEFISGLMAAPKSLWHPVLVTLDESHRYIPNGATFASTEPLVNLATAGRKRGFGALFATQRLSALSTDIRGQCPNRIMGRVDQALDRRAAAEILGFAPSSPEAQGLMRLQHEFWVVGPALAPEPRLHRFSRAITTHLQLGMRDVPSPPTPERVRAMLGRLAEAATKAEATDAGGDAKYSKKYARSMQAESAVDVAGIRKAAYAEGFAAGDAAASARVLEEGRRQALEDARRAVDEALAELQGGMDRPPERAPEPRAAQTAPAPDNPPSEDNDASAPEKLPGGHQKIINALAWFESARIHEPGRHQVGWAANYRADTGHFGNMLSDLARWGLIERTSGTLALTDEGRERAEAPKGKLTAAILVERIKAKLGGPAAKVLGELARIYPSSATRDELAAATGYRADTGNFGNIITELAGPEIATRPRKGEVRLSDWVMLK
jgi:hypothetical protein